MKYAVAILKIKPCEFWELTLAEFNVMMDAYEWNIYQQRALSAESAIWNMLPHVESKNVPSIEDLVGKPPGSKEEEEKEVTTQDDLEEMKRSMGK